MSSPDCSKQNKPLEHLTKKESKEYTQDQRGPMKVEVFTNAGQRGIRTIPEERGNSGSHQTTLRGLGRHEAHELWAAE